MMRFDRLRLVPTVLFGAGLLLASCGHSPPTRFFTLDAVAATTPAASGYQGPPIRVEAVHMPGSLDRPELVRQSGPNLLSISDFARWGAPLSDTARRTLTQDLAARLPNTSVVYPEAPKPPGARGLVVDILALTQTNAEATMDVSWTLQPPRDADHGSAQGGAYAHVAPAAVTRTARLSVAETGGDDAATARALSRLLGRLSDQIAVDVAAAHN